MRRLAWITSGVALFVLVLATFGRGAEERDEERPRERSESSATGPTTAGQPGEAASAFRSANWDMNAKAAVPAARNARVPARPPASRLRGVEIVTPLAAADADRTSRLAKRSGR